MKSSNSAASPITTATASKYAQQLKGSNYLLYAMFSLVIALLMFFWVEMKYQNDYVALKYRKAVHYSVGEEANDGVVNLGKGVGDVKEVRIAQDVKEHSGAGEKAYDGYLFDFIQNWNRKGQSISKFKSIQQKQQRIAQSTPLPRNPNMPPPPSPSSPYTSPTSMPTTPSKPSIASVRANITAAQLELAKRMQHLKNQAKNSATAIEQKTYYEQKYKLSEYKQLPFCIVVPSFNNTAQNRYVHNMNSILMQDYSNYHIVFIDDASEDQTGQRMRIYARDHQISEDKLKIIVNEQRTMAMPNLYKSAKEYCQPYEIFMIVDGDDQLLGRQVLKLFNYMFQAHQVWVAYTNFMSFRGSIGYSRPYSANIIERNAYRKSGFVISHLRAFYTKLFTLVDIKDLQDQNGNWFRAANDVAMYMPILQMTHRHVIYLPQLCYLYNSNTGLNNHRVKLKQQKGNEKKVKMRPSYKALDELFTQEEKQKLKDSIGRRIEIKDKSMEEPDATVKMLPWEVE